MAQLIQNCKKKKHLHLLLQKQLFRHGLEHPVLREPVKHHSKVVLPVVIL